MQSVGLSWCVITQIGGGGQSKNITFYDSGSTLLYATAGGITYRFHGMAAISSNALIPWGTPFDVTTVITTAQSRTVVLMTTDILEKILQGIVDAGHDLGLIKDTQGTTITSILNSVGELYIKIMFAAIIISVIVLAAVYGTRRKTEKTPYEEIRAGLSVDEAAAKKAQNNRLLELQRKERERRKK
jgi:hypothetical protein